MFSRRQGVQRYIFLLMKIKFKYSWKGPHVTVFGLVWGSSNIQTFTRLFYVNQLSFYRKLFRLSPSPLVIFFTTKAENVPSHQFWKNKDWCSHSAVIVGQVMFICCSLMYSSTVFSFCSIPIANSSFSDVSNATFVSFL